MKNIPIIIDGPNYINRVLEFEISPLHVARQLSLSRLRETVDKKLQEFDSVSGLLDSVEFVCSKRRFGPKKGKFSEEQQSLLLDRFRSEKGTHVDIVDIPGASEKGVDSTISGIIEDHASNLETIVLVTSDRDFIPTIRRLRHRTKIILVALNKKFPKELENEGFATLFMQEEYCSIFEYSYPRFHITDLTAENCAVLFSEADDSNHNQLRVTKNGYVFISKTTGAEDLSNCLFRWETFCDFNDYVGPRAASDSEYIEEQFKEIKLAWEKGADGMIDYPMSRF